MKRSPMPKKRATPRREGPPAPRIKPGRVEDPKHLARVRSLPCVVCGAAPPNEAHHPREGQGMGQKAGDYQAISLCPACHRTGPNAFHAGPREFSRRFGSHRELLEKVVVALLGMG